MFYEQNIALSAHRIHIVVILLLCLNLAGCAAPIGVTRVSPQDSYNFSTENVLGADRVSDSTKAVLLRYNLLDSLSADPITTLNDLHEIAKDDERRDILFALSELSYLQGGRTSPVYSDQQNQQARDLFLQSAIYAYFYLLDTERKLPPTAYDERYRVACDLYNRSLWQSFPTNSDGSLIFSDDTRDLIGGPLSLKMKTDGLAWDYNNFTAMLPSDSFAVRGFTVRNRTAGLGLPLVGLFNEGPKSPNGGALPITALLRLPGNFTDYLQGHSPAVLELYLALDTNEILLNDQSVPLETDITAPLAYRLNNSNLWTIGERRFLTGVDVMQQLLFLQPHKPGRIPVVFVHGTASSPIWWAEMVNSLRADPVIFKRFQFWFYQYNSSNVIMLSAAQLREAITAMVNKLDPLHQDQALQKMVVIGHSQGGLLTKMTAINSGNDLWESVSTEDIDEMDIDPELKDFARRLLFFQPLPFVKRVLFISTPHRGSYLSKGWVRSLVRKIIDIPKDIISIGGGLNRLTSRFKLPMSMKGQIPTSIDGMSEENPLLKSLATQPLAPGVIGHSIIAVKPGMEIADGNDGVVAYESAHIEGMESEFIVRAGHSCQDHPFVIEEVRRILLAHIDNGESRPRHADTEPAVKMLTR